MEENCDAVETTFSDLPSEILRYIFSYLPNHSVVRLVCSKWYGVCNAEAVLRDEKIVIDRRAMEYIVEELFFRNKDILRNVYNLHLKDIAFEPYHVSLFQEFDGKLRSLTLQNCKADKFMPFLPFCKNLNSLILNNCCPTIVQSFRRLDGSFVQTGIVSLSIERCNQWSDETMDACFRICPHLRSLTLKSLPFSSVMRKSYPLRKRKGRVFQRSNILTFECIYHAVLIRAAMIVELNFSGISPQQLEKIASIPGLKLRKLELSYCGVAMGGNDHIVSRQPDLENVTLRNYPGKHSNESVDWIEKCSKLTSLEFEANRFSRFVYDGKLLNALANCSHLRELVLITGNSSVIRSDFENHPGTLDLRTLKLSDRADADVRVLAVKDENAAVSERLQLISDRAIDYDCIFKKVSVNLEHLSLGDRYGISSQTLELVSNRFTNLKTLQFTIGDPVMSVFCGEHCSEQLFENLRELKTLQIRRLDYITVRRIVEECGLINLLRRIKAPNLLFLKLRSFNAIDAASLCALTKFYPSLECLAFECCTFTMDPSDLRMMSDWKRLNFVYFDDDEYLGLHRCGNNEDKFDLLVERGSIYLRNHTYSLELEMGKIVNFENRFLNDFFTI